MTDLNRLPRVRALLAEFWQLEAGDEALPLEVLLNLHRGSLRVPLARLAQRVQARRPGLDGEAEAAVQAARQAETLLAADYPELGRVDLSRTSRPLMDLITQDTHMGAGYGFSQELNVAEKDDVTRYLCYQSRKAWRVYEPLAVLHRLAWDRSNRASLAGMLEIQLELVPVAQAAVLDLSKAARGAVFS